jgi:hypothetical protein
MHARHMSHSIMKVKVQRESSIINFLRVGGSGRNSIIHGTAKSKVMGVVASKVLAS